MTKPLTSFPSLNKVFEHLTKAGFKISRGKIYKDRNKNFIKVEADGSVLEKSVRTYAKDHLERKEASINDLSDVHARRASKDIELREIKILRARLEYEKELGKTIPRADFETELATRAGVFDDGFRHLFQMKVHEWIALVGGKPDKAADFLVALNTTLDKQLTTYASIRTYHVIFSKED